MRICIIRSFEQIKQLIASNYFIISSIINVDYINIIVMFAIEISQN